MNVKFCLLIGFLAVVQAVFLPALFPGYPVFNFVLGAFFVVAFLDLGEDAIWGAFCGGLLLDLFSFTSVGFSSLFFVLAAFLAVEVSRRLGSSLVVASVVCFIFSFLYRYVFGFFELSLWIFAGVAMDLVLFWVLWVVFRSSVRNLLADKDVRL